MSFCNGWSSHLGRVNRYLPLARMGQFVDHVVYKFNEHFLMTRHHHLNLSFLMTSCRYLLRGFEKKKRKKIRDYYGSGWVGPGLTGIFWLENRPKIALNQYWYFGVVYIAKSCWLLWFECSVHVSDGFPKKKYGWGWMGGVSSIHFFLNFLNFFNFPKPLNVSLHFW